jgi:predicted HicB family RNase H-like nuclease
MEPASGGRQAAGGAVSRGGRKPAEEPRSTVCTWLPASTHDRVIAAAQAAEKSVSAYVRDVLHERVSLLENPPAR